MTEGDRPKRDGLDDDIRDKLVVAGKSVVSIVPLAGGPLAEIVGAIVPGQRADRIVTYLRALDERVSKFEEAAKEALLNNPYKIDLVEEGGYQSARALSQNRVDQIVAAVTSGISASDADVTRRKRLLILLGELDDDEVNLLNAYGRSYGGADRDAFEAVSRPGPIHMGSNREEIDQESLYVAGKEHLLRLGLLQKNYARPKQGQSVPEFDARAGDFKHSVEISSLGRLLLREIGMPTPFDQQNT
ncbi:MAG: hypothetical protein H7124_01375 [Phycisphaerales bacterium]|nr:hypothetical protein [Hyphomonadaceae bacterium]